MHNRDREQARSYRVYRLLIDLVFCLHPYQIDPAQVPEDLQRLRRAQATTHRCSGTRCEYHNAESFSRYDLSCLRGTGQGPWLVCVCSVQTNGTLRMRLCNFMSAPQWNVDTQQRLSSKKFNPFESKAALTYAQFSKRFSGLSAFPGQVLTRVTRIVQQPTTQTLLGQGRFFTDPDHHTIRPDDDSLASGQPVIARILADRRRLQSRKPVHHRQPAPLAHIHASDSPPRD